MEAIRALERSQDAEAKRILEAYTAKYLKNRKQALFLDKFVRLAWFYIFLHVFYFSFNIKNNCKKNQVKEKVERVKEFHYFAL